MATAEAVAGELSARDRWGLLGWLALVALTAASGIVFQPGAWYAQLTKPPLTPPDWVFPVAWTLLYLAMAVAAWWVWRDYGFAGASVGLGFFIAQLVCNGLWSWLFFELHRPLLAFLDLLLLWVLILGTVVSFWRYRPAAGALLLPYLAWVSFAGYLNLAIWWLNR